MTPTEARARLHTLVGRLVLVRESIGDDVRVAVGRLVHDDDLDVYQLSAPTVRMPHTSLALVPDRVEHVMHAPEEDTDILRGRIAVALNDSTDACARCKTCDTQVDAVVDIVEEQATEYALELTEGHLRAELDDLSERHGHLMAEVETLGRRTHDLEAALATAERDRDELRAALADAIGEPEAGGVHYTMSRLRELAGLPDRCPTTGRHPFIPIDMGCAHPAGHSGPHYNPTEGDWEWGSAGAVAARRGEDAAR